MAPKPTDPTPSFPDDDPSRDVDPAPDTTADPELEKMLDNLAAKIGPAVLGALHTDRVMSAEEAKRAQEAQREAQIKELWTGNPLLGADGKPIEAIPTPSLRKPEGGMWPDRLTVDTKIRRGLGAARVGITSNSPDRAAYPRASKADREKAIHRITHKLEHAPPSRAGSPIWPYVSEETANILYAYAADPNSFPPDRTITMETRSKSTHPRPDLIIRDEDGKPVKGVLLSKLNSSAFPCPIAFCNDAAEGYDRKGSLRMYYGTELFGHHKGIPTGWGPLPSGEDLQDLLKALDGGSMTVVDENWRRGQTLYGILNAHTGKAYGR